MSTEQENDLVTPPILHFLPKSSSLINLTSDDHKENDEPSVVHSEDAAKTNELSEGNTDVNQRLTTVSHSRRVHFPTDDSQLRLISYPSDSFSTCPLLSLGAILQRYRATCQRLQIRPLNCLLDQLSSMDDGRKTFTDRLDCLKIINEKLDLKQIDAIEEILSRCRFHTLDFDSSNFDESAFIQLFDILEYYESCTHINFSNNRTINFQGYQALTKYLRKTTCLERLDMNSMRFDESNIVTFTRSLRLSSTLYELHVESCQLNGKILQKFIENLRSCVSLRELYLCDNRLQIQDSVLINNLIRTCGQFLYSIDLRANALQDSGMSHLASQLSQYDEHHTFGSNLCKLNLENNQISQQGVGFLAKALLHNRTIRSLNLSNNNITNEGLFLLRDALLTNRTLNELILRNCRLTDQAAIALAEYIAESTIIQYIDLRGNTIQASGICGMAIAIKNNKTLLQLDFDPIVVTPTNFNSLFNTNNLDRMGYMNSLLSLSNFRRMTTSFTNQSHTLTPPPPPSGGGTRELLEQKARWMNDIEAVCQRNRLIFEEKLRKQEEEQQQNSNNQTINENHQNQVEQNNATTDNEQIVASNSEEIAQQTDASLKETSDKNENEPTASTQMNEDVQQSTNTSETNDEEEENNVESTDSVRINDIPNSTSLSDPSNEHIDDGKPRLVHSDSLYLIRKQKVQDENDNTSEDESQLSSIGGQIVDGV